MGTAGELANAGFSLLELLIAVAVILVVAAIASRCIATTSTPRKQVC